MISTIKQNPWLKYSIIKPSAKVRLFCFSFAGSGASFFNDWSDKIGEDIEIFPVQLPGRENRLSEDMYTEINPLINNLFAVLKPYVTKYFSFFGYSLGTIISYELACRFRDTYGIQPVHLFLSACRSPRELQHGIRISNLPDSEFIEALEKYYDGIPREIKEDKSILDFFLPIIRSDISVFESYRYTETAPLDCPVAVFGGTMDKLVSKDDLLKWKGYTNSAFSLNMFPGKHFFLKENLGAVMNIITASLGDGK